MSTTVTVVVQLSHHQLHWCFHQHKLLTNSSVNGSVNAHIINIIVASFNPVVTQWFFASCCSIAINQSINASSNAPLCVRVSESVKTSINDSILPGVRHSSWNQCGSPASFWIKHSNPLQSIPLSSKASNLSVSYRLVSI